MIEREADVVVVGAGIVGCATAYYLARRGVRVAVVERAGVAGEQSRKNWGFVRQQGRDPLEVPLVMEANRIWRGLERELDADIEWIQGGNLALAADEARMARFEEWLPIAREFGLETRLLRGRELATVVPWLPSLPPLDIARSWAGYIDATPDLVPVLGEVPGLRGFVLATGFSGHGFAMGPIAGRLVSELIVDGKTSLDISAFRFSRFAEGAIGKPKNVL